MKQILDEIKKREEQAQKQQAEQERQAKKLKELIQRQEQLAEETKALEETSRGEPEDLKEDSRKSAERQAELRNDTQGLADQMEPSTSAPNTSEMMFSASAICIATSGVSISWMASAPIFMNCSFCIGSEAPMPASTRTCTFWKSN